MKDWVMSRARSRSAASGEASFGPAAGAGKARRVVRGDLRVGGVVFVCEVLEGAGVKAAEGSLGTVLAGLGVALGVDSGVAFGKAGG